MSFANLEKVTANPAAGGEIEFTADEDMIVHSCYFSLVTSAVVASRRVHLVADDGSDIFFRTACSADAVASTTTNYCWAGGIAQTSATGIVQAGLPPGGLRLRKGDRLRTLTTSIQAGDDFGPMTLQVERI